MLTSERRIVAIDIGGVIEDSWPDKRAWLLRVGVSPERILTRSELLKILPHGAYDELLDVVFSEAAILQHPLVDGAANGLLALIERFDVVLLSSRSAAKRRVTQQWLEQNGLGVLADRIVSVGNFVSKLAWCRSAGVACFIEDDATRFFDPLGTDVLQVHFNRNDCTVKRERATMISVPTWDDVLRVLDRHHAQTSSADQLRDICGYAPAPPECAVRASPPDIVRVLSAQSRRVVRGMTVDPLFRS